MLQARDFDGAVALLRQRGLTPSYQRLAVTKLVLDEAREHLALDDLIDRAAELDLPLAAEEIAVVLAELKLDLRRIDMPALDANGAVSASQILRVLANPWRLRILCRLSRGEASVGTLERALSLSQSALSQHLARLRLGGLVRARRSRQQIYYAIPDTVRPALMQTLGVLERTCGAASPACGKGRGPAEGWTGEGGGVSAISGLRP